MSPRSTAFDGRGLVRASLAIAAAGAAVAVAGAFVDPRRLALSYLAAWSFAAFVTASALVFLLTCNAMRAGWPVAVRRLLEAMVGALPAIAGLFVPVLAALPWIYPWARPESVTDEATRRAIDHKAAYLSPGPFAARAVVYLAIWIAVAAALRRWSFAQDRGAPGAYDKAHAASAAALPAVALALAFASFDWLMSVDPAWSSTMFPIYVFASGFVAAIAALTVIAWAARRAGPLHDLDPSHFYALGRLLLAFTIFWAYAAFFQFMLIWIAQKPDEMTYYLARWRGPWRAASIALVGARFVVPFALLLPYRIKRRPRRLAWIAGFIVAATYLDFWWLVMPAAPGAGLVHPWIDLATIALVSGLTVAFAAIRLSGRAIAPIGDPRLEEAFAYRSV